MKINPISYTANNQSQKNNTNADFKARALSVPHTVIETEKEFCDNFLALTHAKYYEALDDIVHPENKAIRRDNFAFLSRPWPSEVKKILVDWFSSFTGFPNLKKVSTEIVREYIKSADMSAEMNNTEIAGIGFDCTSSVGLQKALPGSDIDKAYIILNDNSRGQSLVERFKGGLWENVNQFIFSLNHKNTFPEVRTTGQIKDTLSRIDDVVVRTMDLSPDKQKKYVDNILYETTPIVAGEFNIELAKHLPANGLSKEEVKNFAYFLESVKYGYSIMPSIYMEDELYTIMKKSPFATFSDVTQMKAHDILLSSGQKQIKTKLRNRERLSQEFPTWNIDRQYRFVVDMIKYVSEDQSNEFSDYYKNDDDIGARYDKLNRLLIQ